MDSLKADSLAEALQVETEDQSNLRLSKVEKVPSKKSCKMTQASVVLKPISKKQPTSAQHKPQKQPQKYEIDPTFIPCLAAFIISSLLLVYGMVTYEEMDSSSRDGDIRMMMEITLTAMELVALVVMTFNMGDKRIWERALIYRLAWFLASLILLTILGFGIFGAVFGNDDGLNVLIMAVMTLWWTIIVLLYIAEDTASRATSVSRQHDGYGAIIPIPIP